ncbi:ribosomal protein S2, flavodoxin-like domain-containing protein [Zopfochytrium polystomum]|nr:ribosomal protein S2, flavodoxin-like domain-containing protein [Zopfochytrium polystomum]
MFVKSRARVARQFATARTAEPLAAPATAAIAVCSLRKLSRSLATSAASSSTSSAPPLSASPLQEPRPPPTAEGEALVLQSLRQDFAQHRERVAAAGISRHESAQRVKAKLAALVPTTSFSRNFSPLAPVPKPGDPPLPHDVRSAFSVKTLMAAGLHLGHSPKVWNPYMLPYIYGERGGIHIINLEHTLVALRRAINVTQDIAMRNGNVVFVGTRLSLHRLTVAAALRADAFFVTHWVKGTITNRERVLRRSVGFDPDKVTQEMVAADDLSGDDSAAATAAPSKQPPVQVPDLIILLDMPNNLSAVREANLQGVPIIAICDTDCDPRLVQYPIPANDDSVAGVELIAGLLSMACKRGKSLSHLVQ